MSFDGAPQDHDVTISPFRLAFRTVLLLMAAFFTLGTLSCGPEALKGRLSLSGSATVTPLVLKMVDEWKKGQPGIDVRIEAIGSDAGLERLIRYNEADLAMVSRPLTVADQMAASAVGRVLIPLPLAWDAVCLVVPVSNTWAHSLTRNQVAQAFTSAALWSDLDPAWPKRPIHRFALGPNSGTADVLTQAIFPNSTKQVIFTAPQVQASEDDRILARGVAEIEGALGYVGWSTTQEFASTLKVLALDGVMPTPQSISNHTYGLPRQLWLVATKQSLTSAPAARSLVHFLYQHYSSLTNQTGLVPLSAEELQTAEKTLNDLRTP